MNLLMCDTHNMREIHHQTNGKWISLYVLLYNIKGKKEYWFYHYPLPPARHSFQINFCVVIINSIERKLLCKHLNAREWERQHCDNTNTRAKDMWAKNLSLLHPSVTAAAAAAAVARKVALFSILIQLNFRRIAELSRNIHKNPHSDHIFFPLLFAAYYFCTGFFLLLCFVWPGIKPIKGKQMKQHSLNFSVCSVPFAIFK